MTVVIARNNNGPVRMGRDKFRASGLPLHIPSPVALKIVSAISTGVMLHFIVDETGKDIYGGGFKSHDDAELILSEIRNGWELIVKVGKVWMILDGNNNPIVAHGFAKEADAYEYMLKSNS